VSVGRIAVHDEDDAMRELARAHGMEFVDLDEVVIPPETVELIPEAVARANVVLAVADHGGTLKVAMSDPLDFEMREKLQFIVNCYIEVALAPREKISRAINKYYGRVDGNSESGSTTDR
jgi:type IV pilus assembly protein PilB